MNTVLLFIATVVLWGSTWIMIKFQLGVVPPSASLCYRYLCAGVVILIIARLVGKRIRLGLVDHLWCAMQGALMFSINYWLTYLAAEHLTTGIVSVFFAGVSAVTMLVAWIVFRRMPQARALLGACLGIAGTALVFWPEVAGLPLNGPEVISGLLTTLSVVLFACGGLVGAHNIGRGVPRYANIGWGMVYGGIWMAVLTLARNSLGDFRPLVVSAKGIPALATCEGLEGA